MSFYGTNYYQISNAFASFYVTNMGDSNNNFLSSENKADNLRIMADGRDGEVYLSSGNRWIQTEGNYIDNYCKIYHGQPDNSNLTQKYTMELFTELPSEKTYDTIDLNNDVFFKTRLIKYDKAGHIAGTESMFLKIPQLNIFSKVQISESIVSNSTFLNTEQKITINSNGLNDIIKFEPGNKWIQIGGDSTGKKCKIYHNKASGSSGSIIPFQKMTEAEAEKIATSEFVELNLAQNVYLKANVLNYDEAGHTTSTGVQYFKIPLIETSTILKGFEDDINAFTTDMTGKYNTFKSSVETTINTFSNNLNTFDSGLKEANKTISNHTESISDIEELNTTQNEYIENLQKLCGNREDFTNINDGTVNLCNAIGKIDYLRNEGLDEEEKLVLANSLNMLRSLSKPTLCDFINALVEEFSRFGDISTLAGSAAAKAEALTKLNIEERLNKLEEKIK